MVVAVGDRSRRSSVIVVTEIITLLVVSAAPSMAKGTPASSLLVGLRKSQLQDPRQSSEPMAYGGAGNGVAS
jgi:hypothetical protein